MDKKIEKIKISTEFIKLDQFLKWTGIADNGSIAKELILNEKIKVNEEIEIRRGRKLYPEYKIEVFDKIFILE
ncbi:MAG: RNA-binding S4 domain-containing protein [Fusobacterium sp.]|nr:RNA-binding S4 domain-containing protein [Fusobacterium sp.]